MEGLVLLTFASLPHCTKKVGWGGGVGWVGFVLARLTCCELPFLWPELMCAKLYTGPACISRKSGTLSNWEPFIYRERIESQIAGIFPVNILGSGRGIFCSYLLIIRVIQEIKLKCSFLFPTFSQSF